MSLEGRAPSKRREVRKVTEDPNGTKIESHLTVADGVAMTTLNAAGSFDVEHMRVDDMRPDSDAGWDAPFVEREHSRRAVWTMAEEGDTQTVSFMQPTGYERAVRVSVPVVPAFELGRTAEVILDKSGNKVSVDLGALRAQYRDRGYVLRNGHEVGTQPQHLSNWERNSVPVAVRTMDVTRPGDANDGVSYQSPGEFPLHPRALYGTMTETNGKTTDITEDSSRDPEWLKGHLERMGNTLVTEPVNADQQPVLVDRRQRNPDIIDPDEPGYFTTVNYYLANGENVPVDTRASS